MSGGVPHRRWLPAVGVLLLALVVRAAWLARFPTEPAGLIDAEGFHLLAINLLDGRGFTMAWEAPFCPAAVRPPAYPLFLAGVYALLGEVPAHVPPAHMLLEVVTTALVVRLGREVGGRRVALLAGLFYALNGTTQRHVGYLLAEVLLLPLVAGALWQTVRLLRRPSGGRGAAAGVLWGLAWLTKPNVQYLVLAVGTVIVGRLIGVALPELSRPLHRFARAAGGTGSKFDRPPLWSPIVAFAVGVAATLAPWVVRNRVVFGEWFVSSAFAENLARVSAVTTLAEVRGIRMAPWSPTWEGIYGEVASAAAQRYGWDTRGTYELTCDERWARHRQITDVAGEIVGAHRGAFAVAHIKGVARSCIDLEHRMWYFVLTGRDWESLGVLDDVWRRMGESLRIGAVGDALHALWLERVQRIPASGALIWWGLLAARLALWAGALRGTWQLLLRRPAMGLVIAGSALYVLLLPGPIAHDRLYQPAIPAVVVLLGVNGHVRSRSPDRGSRSAVPASA